MLTILTHFPNQISNRAPVMFVTNGSIWPHDNALIALGFARYGRKDACGKVLQCLFEAVAYTELRRLPELFCGFQRRGGRALTLYRVACLPQWAAGTPFLLLRAALGLTFDPACSEICLHNPIFHRFLETSSWAT